VLGLPPGPRLAFDLDHVDGFGHRRVGRHGAGRVGVEPGAELVEGRRVVCFSGVVFAIAVITSFPFIFWHRTT
jgi:hypothetical protein